MRIPARARPARKMAEPKIPSAMADLVAQYDLEHCHRFQITDAAQLVHDERCRVQAPGLQHARHQGHAGKRIVGRLDRHLPQTVVCRIRRPVFIARGQARADESEAIRLRGHPEPSR